MSISIDVSYYCDICEEDYEIWLELEDGISVILKNSAIILECNECLNKKFYNNIEEI